MEIGFISLLLGVLSSELHGTWSESADPLAGCTACEASFWLGPVIPFDEAGLGIIVPLKRQV